MREVELQNESLSCNTPYFLSPRSAHASELLTSSHQGYVDLQFNMTTATKQAHLAEETPPSSPTDTEPCGNVYSRGYLYVEASIWRLLAKIGAWMHTWPIPSPPEPTFTWQISTTFGGREEAAVIELAFYVHIDYWLQVQQGHKYPVDVNLHGGGFTLGTTKDDGRWAAAVLAGTKAIVVSVEYRLAPEFPFPTAVEDGVEALPHLAANADEFGINSQRVALSGFSAGGNMAFSIPLRLRTHLQSMKSEVQCNSVAGSALIPPLPEIVYIIAWYPSLDYRLTRAERRAACSRPEKTLPPLLTNLFYEAYHPEIDSKMSPFASPAAASDEDLVSALPEDIVMFLCDWDMLWQEGRDFSERLKTLGKRVQCTTIEQTYHAFDKSPSPFSVDRRVMLHYKQACNFLSDAFAS